MPPRSSRKGYTLLRRYAQQGFTLIEVLVALVVTSLILAIVMNASLQAKSRSVAALDKEEALTLARGLVAGRSVGTFDPATRTGQSGELRWTATERAIAVNPNGLLLLSEIRVAVRDRKGTILSSLEARRIKAAPRT